MQRKFSKDGEQRQSLMLTTKPQNLLPLERCESIELQCKWLLPDKWPQFSKCHLRDLGGETVKAAYLNLARQHTNLAMYHVDLLQLGSDGKEGKL